MEQLLLTNACEQLETTLALQFGGGMYIK